MRHTETTVVEIAAVTIPDAIEYAICPIGHGL